MQLLLSNRALQDLSSYPDEVGQCIRALINVLKTVPNFNNLQRHLGIKRLKHIKPSAWRHRAGDWRTVFTITKTEPDYTFAIHRCALRHSVYRDMPHHIQRGLESSLTNVTEVDDQLEEILVDEALTLETIDDQYSEHDRYYFLPTTLLDNNDIQLEDLVNFVSTGHYLRSPCLTQAQQNIAEQTVYHQPQIYKMQGAAGTGKTTVALYLAAQAIEQHLFPVLILPNQNLVRFSIQSLTTLHPTFQIHSNFTDSDAPDLAIFARDELLYQLANDQDRPLSRRLGNQKVHEVIRTRAGQKYQKIKDYNLYHLYCAYISEHSYSAHARDALAQSYAEALSHLERHQDKIVDALESKDLSSQAQRALANLESQTPQLQQIAGDRPLLLIIDEVQDYYWSQLLALLTLSQSQELQAPTFLLGDENQRVTLSGFSWATLSQKIKQTFRTTLQEISLPAQNFRNTSSIAKAANFILLNAFDRNQFGAKTRHFPSPSQPEHCFDVGSLPRLVQANPDWFNALVHHIAQQPINGDDPSRYVFIVRDEDLQDQFMAQLSEKTDSPIVVYTVAEAKGQEFDAAILVFPFRLKRKQLAVDDLYDWYTSMTRARRYLALLVTDDELKWIKKKVTSSQSLNEIFDVVQPLAPQEFAQQMQFEARTLITAEQLRHKKVRKLVHEILDCLKGKAPLREFEGDRHSIGLSIWGLAEQIYQESQHLAQLDQALSLEQPSSLNRPVATSMFNDLILYAGSAPFMDDEGLNTWEDSLVQVLEKRFQKEPKTAHDALTQIVDPFLRVLMLRAAAYSWDAAETATKTMDQTRLIHGITRDLERRSLKFESDRIKAQFLSEQPEQAIFLPRLLKNTNTLIDGLCEEFIQSLTAALEVQP